MGLIFRVFYCQFPSKVKHHNGNYDWEFKRIPFIGNLFGLYYCSKLEYKD